MKLKLSVKRYLSPCLVFTLLLAFGFTPNLLAQGTLKIGVVAVLSGDKAPFGVPSVNAAQLVVDDVNAKGGVLGKKVEIVVIDDQCKPELATNVATKLVESKVDLVMGHTCSSTTKATLPIYTKQKMITISPAATNGELTKGQYPYFFRTISPDSIQAKVGVDFVINKLGAKKVAILHDKSDYGKVFAEFSKQFIEESGVVKLALFEGITPGQMDYSAVIQKVRSQNVDAVLFGGYHPEASKLVQGMHKRGMKIPFVSDDAINGEVFIKLSGAESEGVYATGSKSNLELPLYKKAIADHQAKYGNAPGSFFFEAYAATQMLINAVEKSGGTDPDKLVKALHSEYLDTPVGKISFDKTGEVIGNGVVVFQVQQAKFVEVK